MFRSTRIRVDMSTRRNVHGQWALLVIFGYDLSYRKRWSCFFVKWFHRRRICSFERKSARCMIWEQSNLNSSTLSAKWLQGVKSKLIHHFICIYFGIRILIACLTGSCCSARLIPSKLRCLNARPINQEGRINQNFLDWLQVIFFFFFFIRATVARRCVTCYVKLYDVVYLLKYCLGMKYSTHDISRFAESMGKGDARRQFQNILSIIIALYMRWSLDRNFLHMVSMGESCFFFAPRGARSPHLQYNCESAKSCYVDCKDFIEIE